MKKIIALGGIAIVCFNMSSCGSSHLETIKTSKQTLIQSEYYEDSAPDLWESIELNYEFAPQYYNHKLVKSHIVSIGSNPEMLREINQRASLFLYYIYNEIKLRGMPSELALLPAVESAYDPYAYSPAGAAGLWQFTERTGRAFGLGNSWWYSSRRDFEKSTSAALDYLDYLYAKYENWELSLAAYNAGEKAVNKAIAYNKARGKATDYWHLYSLPAETENYVPRLIAYNYIFSKMQRNKLGLESIAEEPFWTKVYNEYQLPLAQLVDHANINEESFFLLNAAHNQWVTAPHKNHLFVPINEKDKLLNALANFSQTAPLWVSYKLKAKDTVSSIADKFSIETEVIKRLNKVNKLTVGDYLILPINKDAEYVVPFDADPPRYVSKKSAVRNHRVKQGENLSTIARNYKVPVSSLQKMNDIGNPDLVYAGTYLTVEDVNKYHSPTVFLTSDYNREVIRGVYYRVGPGDSLYGIASKFNISVEQLRKWNQNKSLGDYLRAGQVIRLYLDVTDL